MHRILGYKRLTFLPKYSDLERITYKVPILGETYSVPGTETSLGMRVFKKEGFLEIILLETDTYIIINFDNELEFYKAYSILTELKSLYSNKDDIEIPVRQIFQIKQIRDLNPCDIGLSSILSFKNEDVIITDPCYIMREKDSSCDVDDWDRCNCGSNLEALGITYYDTKPTLFGDWQCCVVNKDSGEIIGNFSSDSGMVSVINYNQVLMYNPEITKKGLEESKSALILRGYTGDISIKTRYVCGEYPRWERYVEGRGSINFGSVL